MVKFVSCNLRLEDSSRAVFYCFTAHCTYVLISCGTSNALAKTSHLCGDVLAYFEVDFNFQAYEMCYFVIHIYIYKLPNLLLVFLREV